MADPALLAGILGFAGGGAVVACLVGCWWSRRLVRSCQAALDDATDLRTLPRSIADLVDRHQVALDDARRDAALGARIAEERSLRFSRMLDALEDAVIVLDSTGQVVERNAVAATIAGSRQHRDPRRLDSVISSVPAVREILDLARGLADADAAATRHTSFRVLDGERGDERDFEASIRRLDESGRCVVVLHETTRDRELARVRSEFVAQASHELRTPLSSIRATLEMLEEGELEDAEARGEMLAIACEEADRLARLVDDMLDISRIEAGVARPSIERVDLGGLAIEVVDGLQAAAERRDLRLEVHVEGDGLIVDGDRAMLATVIGNLVGNAVKYVPEGERITVAVGAEDLTRSVVVTVTDTGLGIPPEDLPRIFEKFYRVRRYERRARGTGLGLDLCRNIVEQVHRGRIGVDSTLGEGARFWFGVPARHASSVAA
jgi:two-component system phosphate regulon sensor histidine kinase PhoR